MSEVEDDGPILAIPDNLQDNPKMWKRADVLAFLEANKMEYDLDDKHIDVIRTNEVTGLVFLDLTKEELAKSYSLPLGPAAIIEKLIQKLLRITKEKAEKKKQGEIPEVDTATAPPNTKSPSPTNYQDESVTKDESARVPESNAHWLHSSKDADVVTPTGPPPISSPLVTYKVKCKSSSMSAPGYQTREDLTPLLENELAGTIYKDVQGFDKLFGSFTQQTNPVMESSTFNNWLMSAKSPDNGAFENHGVEWFQKFSQQIDELGLNTASRFYYGSGDSRLKDAYHGAQRKLDICLSRKLENPSTKIRHSWKDVLVLGEFKSNSNKDLRKTLILQLARYVREAFGAQPGRRFMHAFTVCGERARFWMFDRLGVSISIFYDISTESGQRFFMHGLLCYMQMTASQLGFDERYKDNSGEIFLPSPGGPCLSDKSLGDKKIYLHLSDKKFQLMEVLSWGSAIVTRGTLCWLAKECGGEAICTDNKCTTCKECTGKLCVIKEAWRDNKLTAESKLWHLAKQKEVLGCLDVFVACDADIVRMGGEEEHNVRQWFDYTEAKPIEWKYDNECDDMEEAEEAEEMGETEETKSSHRLCLRKLLTINSEDEDGEDFPLSTAQTLNPQTATNGRKRPGGFPDIRPSKTRKLHAFNVVQARTRNFMVIRNVGEKLNRKIQPLELTKTLRDAIKTHRSLFEKAGILHCDVSMNNIMRTRIGDSSGLKGFLIDLDYAQQLQPIPSQEQSPCKTGTAPFMAVEILLQESPVYHTYRHDLESFFYVLIWVCIQNPFKSLQSWVKGLSALEFVDKKKVDVTDSFEGRVLNKFRKDFIPLRELALEFRDILFYEPISMDPKVLQLMEAQGFTKKVRLGTPTGDAARCEIYEKIIKAFDNCIARLRPTDSALLEEWVEV